jgi:hypothetical protein
MTQCGGRVPNSFAHGYSHHDDVMLRSTMMVHPLAWAFLSMELIEEGDALGGCRTWSFVGWLIEDNAAGS